MAYPAPFALFAALLAVFLTFATEAFAPEAFAPEAFTLEAPEV